MNKRFGTVCPPVPPQEKRHATRAVSEMTWYRPLYPALLATAAIFTGTGIDFDLVTDLDEQRNLYFETARQLG